MLQILFYCHHPDLLLTQKRSWAHSLYRAPLDFAEQSTTGKADKLLVNSLYTQGRFMRNCCIDVELQLQAIFKPELYSAVLYHVHDHAAKQINVYISAFTDIAFH